MDQTTSLSNIKAAIDAEIVQQRTQLEDNQTRREEWLKNALKSSQDISVELARSWEALKSKVTDQELMEFFNSQEQLCESIIQGKYALINDLKQELNRIHIRHGKILEENTREIDLMCEKWKDQVKMERSAYREKLEQTGRNHQQEMDNLLAKEVAEWEGQLKDTRDKELQKLMKQRKEKKMEREKFYQMKLKDMRSTGAIPKVPKKSEEECIQHVDKILERSILESDESKVDINVKRMGKAKIKHRIVSLQTELIELEKLEKARQQENCRERAESERNYKRLLQKYERLQKQIKHLSVAEAKRYEDMYQMIDRELKELAERALTIDSEICTKILGIPWERPQLACLEHNSPIQPQKHPARLSQPQIQTEKRRVYENLLSKKQTEVLELLCDAVDFANLPAPLQKKDQSVENLCFLCDLLNIENKDLPKLADFIFEHAQQHREHIEDTCTESSGMAEAAESSHGTYSISDLIRPEKILPALTSFLEQRKRERSAHHLSSTREKAQSWITPKDLSHWDSLGIIISEDKLKLWRAMEKKLREHHSVLTDIAYLVPENERLRQRNKELRMKQEQRCKVEYNSEISGTEPQ